MVTLFSVARNPTVALLGCRFLVVQNEIRVPEALVEVTISLVSVLLFSVTVPPTSSRIPPLDEVLGR